MSVLEWVLTAVCRTIIDHLWNASIILPLRALHVCSYSFPIELSCDWPLPHCVALSADFQTLFRFRLSRCRRRVRFVLD
jgi:hypothetical protein